MQHKRSQQLADAVVGVAMARPGPDASGLFSSRPWAIGGGRTLTHWLQLTADGFYEHGVVESAADPAAGRPSQLLLARTGPRVCFSTGTLVTQPHAGQQVATPPPPLHAHMHAYTHTRTHTHTHTPAAGATAALLTGRHWRGSHAAPLAEYRADAASAPRRDWGGAGPARRSAPRRRAPLAPDRPALAAAAGQGLPSRRAAPAPNRPPASPPHRRPRALQCDAVGGGCSCVVDADWRRAFEVSLVSTGNGLVRSDVQTPLGWPKVLPAGLAEMHYIAGRLAPTFDAEPDQVTSPPFLHCALCSAGPWLEKVASSVTRCSLSVRVWVVVQVVAPLPAGIGTRQLDRPGLPPLSRYEPGPEPELSVTRAPQGLLPEPEPEPEQLPEPEVAQRTPNNRLFTPRGSPLEPHVRPQQEQHHLEVSSPDISGSLVIKEIGDEPSEEEVFVPPSKASWAARIGGVRHEQSIASRFLLWSFGPSSEGRPHCNMLLAHCTDIIETPADCRPH